MANLSKLMQVLSKLPEGSKAAQELVAAEEAARAAQKAAQYAGHTPPTETGRKAIAKAKATLAKPEKKAELEAEFREKGKQKFLEPSKVKERLYHGTSRQEINEFKTGKMLKERQYPGNTIEPWAVDNRDAVFLTPNPEFAGGYSGGEYEMSLGYGPSIYPVHVQVKNPWDYDNPEHLEQAINAYKEKYPLERFNGAVPSSESMRHHRFEKNVRELPLREKDNWSGIENAALQEIIRDLGFDSFFVKEAGIKNLGIYDPKRIKSAIGNRGTYDITDPDINKKHGGLAHMAEGGTVTGSLSDWYKSGGHLPQRKIGGAVNKFSNNPLLNINHLLGVAGFSDEKIKRRTRHHKRAEQKMAEGGEANLAPYGMRHSGEGVKGKGYFGVLPSKEGISTEISAEDDLGEFPLLVPTLTREEIEYLLAGGQPTEAIYRKAAEYARTRQAQGKSPFASPTELRYPLPTDEVKMAVGGKASKAMRFIQDIAKEVRAAEEAGDTKTALEKNKQLNEAIKSTVNAPDMPRAKPLKKQEIEAYAERMAPQIEGKLTRQEKTAKTVAGKTQQQFEREKTLPVSREVMPGKVDPMAPLRELTLEEQKDGVLLGLPGDPTLARMLLKGIGDVEFERAVGLHGGPRYGDDEKLWASNLSAASGLMGAGQRASQQFGGVPVYASYMKMPSGFGFAQHYLDSLMQYQRPDLLPKKARLQLEKDIKSGFINAQGKRVTFPNFPGFENLDDVYAAALKDSNLRTHIADRLEKGKTYGLRPAGDVQFAASHPELTNLETGASGFTIGELRHLDPLTPSEHPTYSHDIAGKVLGQTRNPIPYDLLYRDQLQLIQQNPRAPEFNTLKMLGARQKIDEQLINEINEYQEILRRLTGKKKGGEVHMAGGGVPPMDNPMGDVAFSPTAGVDDRSTYQKIYDLFKQKVKEQGREELASMKDPRAITDLINKGLIAENLGGVVDLFNLPLEAADALINLALKTDKRYVSSEQPFGGSESMKRGMEKIGAATTTERPLMELTTGIVGPGIVTKGAQLVPKAAAGVKKVGEALAPTAASMMESQLQKSGMMMPIAPEGKAGKVKAPANDVGFYNPAEKAALNLQRKKGTGDAFLSDLKKQPGVNDERLAELGLDQFKGRTDVTKEEIIRASQESRIPLRESVKRERNEARIEELEERYDEIRELMERARDARDDYTYRQLDLELRDNHAEQRALKSVDEAKFSPADYPDYNMPGGKNYREIRVGLPENESSPNFIHSAHHGNQPNVLFHLRVADHTDAEGKKGLLIDELQSDWHQKGREKGYKGEAARKAEEEFKKYSQELASKYDLSPNQNIAMYGTMKGIKPEEIKKYEELQSAWVNSKEGVPDAPFKDNWYQLGLKRAIKEAADNGMDRVYLTTGARQADRYDLSKQISFLSIESRPNGMVRINASKDGEPVILTDVLKDQLPDYVGKEMAKKAIADIDAGNPAIYSDLDLRVGGEGMKQYYDKNYRNYLEKYAKQFGSKLGMTELKGTREEWPYPITIKKEGDSYRLFGSDPRTGSFNNNLAGKDFDSFEAAEKARDHFYEGTVEPVYYIDITDAMRESAKKGQSYKKGGAVKRKAMNLDEWYRSGAHLPR